MQNLHQQFQQQPATSGHQQPSKESLMPNSSGLYLLPCHNGKTKLPSNTEPPTTSSGADIETQLESDETTNGAGESISNVLLQWETFTSPLVDQGPLRLSCSAFDRTTCQLIGVTSLRKNRFCEVVKFDVGEC